MPTLRIDHAKCTECRMCYYACEEIGINAVYIDLEPRHRFEIDAHKCTYPTCVVCLWLEVLADECTGDGACLQYCPAPGALVQYEESSPSGC